MTVATLHQTGSHAAPVARHAVESSAMQGLAFNLYLLFIVSWFLHLPARFPVLGQVRIDLLLVLAISGLTVASVPPLNHRLDKRINQLLIALFAYAFVTLPFVEWPGSVLKHGIPELVKAVVFYYFTALLVTSERTLSRLLLVFVACQSIRVLEPLYLHVTQGYWGARAYMGPSGEFMTRLSGAPSDIVNPNGLAAVIVTIVPYLHYLWTGRRVGQAAYLLLLPPLLYALTLTGSRSGLLGLAATLGIIWWQSRRKLLLALAGVAVLLVALPRLSEDLRDRYLSIVETDTRNRSTAQLRLDLMESDFAVAMRRPFFGHGLGTTLEANANFAGHALLAHNLFIQVAQELGFVGMAIFVALLVSIAFSVRATLRAVRASPSASPLIVRLCYALQVCFFVNILSSIFTYGLASYEWYLMAGLANVASFLVREAGEQHAAATHTPERGGQSSRVSRVAGPDAVPAWRAQRVRSVRRRTPAEGSSR